MTMDRKHLVDFAKQALTQDDPNNAPVTVLAAAPTMPHPANGIGFFRNLPAGKEMMDEFTVSSSPILTRIMSFLGSEKKDSSHLNEYNRNYYNLKSTSKEFYGNIKIVHRTRYAKTCCETVNIPAERCYQWNTECEHVPFLDTGCGIAAICYQIACAPVSLMAYCSGYFVGAIKDNFCIQLSKRVDHPIILPRPSEAIKFFRPALLPAAHGQEPGRPSPRAYQRGNGNGNGN